jgi:SpoVK/Ycf46/Vps4 family AAA+-type ATPase
MPTLSPNQQKLVDELIPIAELALDKSTADLPIRPRTHTLICAPSGAGKSHLMGELGGMLDVPVLHLNVSTWAPISSKANEYTWDTIVEFVKENPRGIIVLDEIDKIDSQKEWQGYIRLEIHDLLDGKIPKSVDISGGLW